jgi:hypothetical protein
MHLPLKTSADRIYLPIAGIHLRIMCLHILRAVSSASGGNALRRLNPVGRDSNLGEVVISEATAASWIIRAETDSAPLRD